MKKTVAILANLLLSIHVHTANAAPAYDPHGVQNDVAVDEVLQGGWRVLYQGLYSDRMQSVPALFRGACDRIMLASRKVGSSTFDVLATVESDVYVPLNTPRHTSVLSNGAQWYKNDQSMGFAGSGAIIKQTSADTNDLGARDRLSWHTIRIVDEPDIRLNPGWRSGNKTKLDNSDQWERLILTTITPSSGATSTGQESCLPLG